MMQDPGVGDCTHHTPVARDRNAPIAVPILRHGTGGTISIGSSSLTTRAYLEEGGQGRRRVSLVSPLQRSLFPVAADGGPLPTNTRRAPIDGVIALPRPLQPPGG